MVSWWFDLPRIWQILFLAIAVFTWLLINTYFEEQRANLPSWCYREVLGEQILTFACD